MAVINFNYRDFLGGTLENATCKIKPQQPTLNSGTVRLNSAIYALDGESIELPIGIYVVSISGDGNKIVGYFEITNTTPNPSNLSSILNLVSDSADIPLGTPISAISGLQAELDSKLAVNSPLLNNLLTPAERSKLTSVQSGATANSSDTFLLSRANHNGEQPISSITGLNTRLIDAENNISNTVSRVGTLEGRLEFTLAERTKLSGIATNATANQTDAFLTNRSNHTGTQAQSTVTGLETRLTGIDTSIASLTAREIFTTAEKTKLTGIATGATANSTDTFLLSRTNHTGTQAQSTITNLTTDLTTINSSISSLNARNIYTTAEQTKLAGIATGATVNSTDAFLLSRANHTGTQPISSVSGLQSAIDAKLTVTGTPTANQVPVFDGTNTVWQNQATGGLSAADRTKLDGIQPLATANSTDAFLLSRANHTGGQPTSSIFNLDASLAVRPELGSSPNFNNLTLTGQVSISNAGSNNRPVTLSTYAFSTGEEGLSVGQLRVNGGRMDFLPLDNKAEMRVSGASTTFGIYNITNAQNVLTVNPSGDMTVTRDLIATRDIRASGLFQTVAASTPTTDTQGRIWFTRLNDQAVRIRDNNTWISVPNTVWVDERANRAEFTFIGSTAPTSPANGNTWAEPTLTGGFNYWVWNATRSVWMSMNTINVQSPVRWGLSSSQDVDVAVLEQYTGFWIERAYMKFLVANNNATNFFTFTLRNLTALSVNTDIGSFNTSADTNNVQLTRDFITNSPLYPFSGLLSTRLVVARTGTTAATNFTLHIQGRYYR